MESGFVPVGAGEVGWWSGDPCGRPSSFHREGRGRPQGSPPFPSPPPPLRGRGAFSPKNLYLRGPLHPPLDAINRVPTDTTRFPYLICIDRKGSPLLYTKGRSLAVALLGSALTATLAPIPVPGLSARI